MRRITISLVIVASFFNGLNAQKTVTIEDVFKKTELNPAVRKQLKWAGSSKQISWVDDDQMLMQRLSGNFELSKIDTIISSRGINKDLLRFPQHTWLDESRFIFGFKGNQLIYNISTKQIEKTIELGSSAENLDFATDYKTVAYTRGNDLFIKTDQGETNISNESNPSIVYGQSVHRNEFGISKGTFWSPTNAKLAYYRMDQSMVTDYPIVNIGTKPAEVNPIKYPMAGQKSHHVTVGVYDLATSKTTYLQTGLPADQYLTNISWTPDEQYILIAVVNRDQNEMKLNQYRVSDGSFVKTLITETDPQWVEPEHPAVFVPGKNDQFIWQSERSGLNQLYLYNLEGELKKNLCSSNMLVVDFLGFSNSGEDIYAVLAENDGMDRVLWKLPMVGNPEKLTENSGTHRIQLSPDAQVFIDEFSCAINANFPQGNPYELQLVSADKQKRVTASKAKDPLLGYQLPKPKLVSVKTSDGTKLNGRLFTPPNMKPGKKYPVVVYVYGGPHAQMVTNSWLGGGNLWMSWMASQGYVVWTMDNRGSDNRGLEFEQAIHQKLGYNEMEDQMAGVEYLKTLPYVDASRIGVHGWSFGGFMTTGLMSKYPGVFKAGVAGGPVIDWRLYEIMYTERYLDTPEQNPNGYVEGDLTNFAGNIQGRLMLIHGTVDDVVVWQHSQEMVKKCVEEGVLIDYMIYPEHPHNVIGKDRLHLYRTISRYLMDNL